MRYPSSSSFYVGSTGDTLFSARAIRSTIRCRPYAETEFSTCLPITFMFLSFLALPSKKLLY